MHSHGFPNLLIMSGPQGGGGQFNFIRGLESHTDYVVWMLSTLRERGAACRRYPQGAGSGLRRALPRRRHLVPGRCATACRTTTARATPQPGSLAYYGGPKKWHELRAAAQASLDPYVFETAAAEKSVASAR
jgi:hypothetical protein